MRVIFHRIIIIFLILLDILLTILSFSIYNSNWQIDVANILKVLSVSNYSFWTSPFDFLVASIIRMVVLISCWVLVRFGKSKSLSSCLILVDFIAIACYISSVVKILAFDEIPHQLNNPGIYSNAILSILFSIIMCIMVRKSILSDQFGYQRLQEEREENDETINVQFENRVEENLENGNAPSTSENTNKKDEKCENEEESKEEKEHRLPFGEHIKCILKLCSKQWKWFLISYILLLIYTALDLIEPAIYSRMMTNAISMKSFDVIKQSCIFLGVLQISSAIVSTLKTSCMGFAERNTAKSVRISLFEAILHQDISFFDENNTGQLVSRISHDSDSISNSLPNYIETTTLNLVNFFGALPITFYYSWQLALTTFITFPISMILTKIYGLYVEKLSEKENDATAHANDTVEEVLAAIRTVRSFAAEKKEAMRYAANTNEWFKISMRSVLASSVFGFAWNCLWNTEDVVIYLYGGYLALNGRMRGEDLLSFVFYHWKIHTALHNFSSLFSDLMKTIGSSRKVIYIMNRKPELDYKMGTEKPEGFGKIIFEDVEFAYPTRRKVDVLKGLSLIIEPGKTIAFVGPSGNGKTTIVSLIEQFYAPRSGRILLDGINVQNIDHEYYHAAIALVAQEPTLFSGSIRDNIKYGSEDATEEDIVRVAEMANVTEFVEKMEKKFDTKCGEKGVQMSGGQKQRIAIARALIRNPKVLILDEATSALDAESEALVQDALNRCAKDRTVIVIAHRLSTVKNADRIAVIEKGNVSEIGSHAELMRNQDGIYYKLVSKQLEPKIEETF